MLTFVLYGFTGTLLLISASKEKKKTKMALKKAWKSFHQIIPQLLTILLLIGFISTLTMVGVAILPLEVSCFGQKQL